MCHVACTAHQHGLTLDVDAAGLQHVLKEINVAVACSLGTDERAAKLKALACEDAAEGVGELLILSEHVAYLATAYANVACGNVLIGTDVAVELVHESLAEAHDLGSALAAGREVGTSLAAAHGQRGERVLESLLEGEELKDAEVYRFVETNAAFVRADGVVVLHTVAHVGLYVAFVVNPCHAELNQSVRNAQALNEVGFLKLGMLVVLFFDGAQHLTDGLNVFGLVRESLLQSFYNFYCFHCFLSFIVVVKNVVILFMVAKL